MATDKRLQIEIVADSSKFKEGLERSLKDLGNFKSQVEKTLSGMSVGVSVGTEIKNGMMKALTSEMNLGGLAGKNLGKTLLEGLKSIGIGALIRKEIKDAFDVSEEHVFKVGKKLGTSFAKGVKSGITGKEAGIEKEIKDAIEGPGTEVMKLRGEKIGNAYASGIAVAMERGNKAIEKEEIVHQNRMEQIGAKGQIDAINNKASALTKIALMKEMQAQKEIELANKLTSAEKINLDKLTSAEKVALENKISREKVANEQIVLEREKLNRMLAEKEKARVTKSGEAMDKILMKEKELAANIEKARKSLETAEKIASENRLTKKEVELEKILSKEKLANAKLAQDKEQFDRKIEISEKNKNDRIEQLNRNKLEKIEQQERKSFDASLLKIKKLGDAYMNESQKRALIAAQEAQKIEEIEKSKNTKIMSEYNIDLARFEEKENKKVKAFDDTKTKILAKTRDLVKDIKGIVEKDVAQHKIDVQIEIDKKNDSIKDFMGRMGAGLKDTAGGFMRDLKSGFNTLQQAGYLVMGAGAAGVYAFDTATSKGADAQTQRTQAMKYFDIENIPDQKKFGDTMKALSEKYGTSQKDTLSAAQDLATAGVITDKNVNNIGKLIEQILIQKTAGGGTQEAKSIVGQTLGMGKAFGMDMTNVDNWKKVMDLTNKAVQISAGTDVLFKEYLPTAQVMPAQAGLNKEEAAAVMATIVGTTGNEAEAATQLERLTQSMFDLTPGMKDTLEAGGIKMSPSDMVNMTFNEIAKKVPEMGKQFGGLFTDKEKGDRFGMSGYLEIFKKAAGDFTGIPTKTKEGKEALMQYLVTTERLSPTGDYIKTLTPESQRALQKEKEKQEKILKEKEGFSENTLQEFLSKTNPNVRAMIPMMYLLKNMDKYNSNLAQLSEENVKGITDKQSGVTMQTEAFKVSREKVKKDVSVETIGEALLGTKIKLYERLNDVLSKNQDAIIKFADTLGTKLLDGFDKMMKFFNDPNNQKTIGVYKKSLEDLFEQLKIMGTFVMEKVVPVLTKALEIWNGFPDAIKLGGTLLFLFSGTLGGLAKIIGTAAGATSLGGGTGVIGAVGGLSAALSILTLGLGVAAIGIMKISSDFQKTTEEIATNVRDTGKIAMMPEDTQEQKIEKYKAARANVLKSKKATEDNYGSWANILTSRSPEEAKKMQDEYVAQMNSFDAQIMGYNKLIEAAPAAKQTVSLGNFKTGPELSPIKKEMIEQIEKGKAREVIANVERMKVQTNKREIGITAASGNSGHSTVVNVHVAGTVVTENQLTESVIKGLNMRKSRLGLA